MVDAGAIQPVPTYCFARRALALGLAAVGVRAATIVFVARSMEAADTAATTAASGAWFFMNVAGTAIGLIGIAYAAIATHRRERGPALVLAWLLTVAAVFFEVQPFVFASFADG